MASSTVSIKRRLIAMIIIVFLIMLGLITRLGYLQIVKGEELKKETLEQSTRDIQVKAKRGIIYDRKGKKLATSISNYTVRCWPSVIEDEDKREYSKKIADILEMDEEQVYKIITSNRDSLELKRWIDKEKAEVLRNERLDGIEIEDDIKRYYPYGKFAANLLGNTNRDSIGQYGIERTYNKYLTGTPGRWIKAVDGKKRELPNNYGRLYEPVDGLNVVLTIDEAIQHFAEKAAQEALVANKAKRVSILVMEPKTGDMLAVASLPEYDPNNRNELLYDPKQPWISLSEEQIDQWNKQEWKQKESILFDSWKNFAIDGIYEPGSTFKIITAAAGLEENVVTPESKFYCDGYVTQVKGANIKCWRYYRPHGEQTLIEGLQNSCNEVIVDIGLRLGKESLYKYIKAFGFGEKTDIDVNGEEAGIVRSPENMREVNLATVSFGQGISVTPIQLITAVSSLANDGNLIEPRVADKLVDQEGNIVQTFEPKVKRKVISKETSDTMLEILESVVSEGSGKNAYLPGYRVGGKTGTAQKIKDGKYEDGYYIASFVGIAPVNDPKIAVLVIIDEPAGTEDYQGGKIAAPVAREVIKDTLNYLDVPPQ